MENYFRDKVIASMNSKSFANLMKSIEKSSSAPNKRKSIDPEIPLLTSPRYNPNEIKVSSTPVNSKFINIQSSHHTYKKSLSKFDLKNELENTFENAFENKKRLKPPTQREIDNYMPKDKTVRLETEFKDFKEKIFSKPDESFNFLSDKGMKIEVNPNFIEKDEYQSSRKSYEIKEKETLELNYRIYNEKIKQLKEKIEEEMKNSAKLKSLLGEKEESLNQAKKKINELMDEVKKLKIKQNTFFESNDLMILNSKIFALGEKISKLEKINDEIIEENRIHKSKLIDKDIEIASRTDEHILKTRTMKESDITEKDKKIEMLESKIARLYNSISELTKENQNLRALIIENTDLKNELKAKSKEIEHLINLSSNVSPIKTEPEEKNFFPKQRENIILSVLKKHSNSEDFNLKNRKIEELEERLIESQRFIDLYEQEKIKNEKLSEQIIHLHELLSVYKVAQSDPDKNNTINEKIKELKHKNVDLVSKVLKSADEIYEKNHEIKVLTDQKTQMSKKVTLLLERISEIPKLQEHVDDLLKLVRMLKSQIKEIAKKNEKCTKEAIPYSDLGNDLSNLKKQAKDNFLEMFKNSISKTIKTLKKDGLLA